MINIIMKKLVIKARQHNIWARRVVIAYLAIKILWGYFLRFLFGAMKTAVSFGMAVILLFVTVVSMSIPKVVLAEEIIVDNVEFHINENTEEINDNTKDDNTQSVEEIIESNSDLNNVSVENVDNESNSENELSYNNFDETVVITDEEIKELRENPVYSKITDEEWVRYVEYAKENMLSRDSFVKYLDAQLNLTYTEENSEEVIVEKEDPEDDIALNRDMQSIESIESVDNNELSTVGNTESNDKTENDESKFLTSNEEDTDYIDGPIEEFDNNDEKFNFDDSEEQSEEENETNWEDEQNDEVAETDVLDSEEIATFEVVKNPIINIQPVGFNNINGYLLGSIGTGFSISSVDFDSLPDDNSSVATKVYSNYYDGCLSLDEGQIYLPIDGEYNDVIEFVAEDEMGNRGEAISFNVVVDNNSPCVSFVQESQSDGTVMLKIKVAEVGNVQTGLDRPDIWINGECSEDIKATPSVVGVNTVGQEVVLEQEFNYLISEDGTSVVTVVCYDSVGNSDDVTEYVKVKKKYMNVSVRMPSKVDLTVDPWKINGSNSIYSDEFQIVNNSECDIVVDLNRITMAVNHSTDDENIIKEANIYLKLIDQGTIYNVSEGTEEDIMRVVIPCSTNGNNVLNLKFIGEVANGSEGTWNAGDINVNLEFECSTVEEIEDEEKNKKKNLDNDIYEEKIGNNG